MIPDEHELMAKRKSGRWRSGRGRRGSGGAASRKRDVVMHVSVAICIAFVGAAFVGMLTTPHDPLRPYVPMQPPSSEFLLGTDEIGRDILSRIIVGSRYSLLVSGLSVTIAVLLGTAIGLFAGYYRTGEALLMRAMDALWAYPSILLALGLGVALGPSVTTLVLAIGIALTPVYARLVYGQSLSIKQNDYVSAAVALGASGTRVQLCHILPNLVGPVIVQSTLNLGTAILFEASLSFLGMGIQPPTPSWGAMLRSAYVWMELAPWMALAPGLAIYAIVIALNLLGDRLRHRLDPRKR